MAPEVLTKGLFRRVLEAPSHVILNHANCWTESNPTLAPNAQGAAADIRVHDFDDGRTSDMDKLDTCDKGMTAVSLTLRLNTNKFTTLTYYKPKLAAPTQENQGQPFPVGQQKTFIEDFAGGQQPMAM